MQWAAEWVVHGPGHTGEKVTLLEVAGLVLRGRRRGDEISASYPTFLIKIIDFYVRSCIHRDMASRHGITASRHATWTCATQRVGRPLSADRSAARWNRRHLSGTCL
jgi:hypothetical protein